MTVFIFMLFSVDFKTLGAIGTPVGQGAAAFCGSLTQCSRQTAQVEIFHTFAKTPNSNISEVIS